MTSAANEKIKSILYFCFVSKGNHYLFVVKQRNKTITISWPFPTLNRQKNGQINLPMFRKSLCKCSEDHIRIDTQRIKEKKR